MDQPAEQIAAADAVKIDHLGHCALARRRRLAERWPLAEGPVRPVLVVVARIASEDVLQMPTVDDQQPVEAFPAGASNPALGVGSRLRGPHRRFDHTDAFGVVALLSVFSLGEVLNLLITRNPASHEQVGVIPRSAVTAESLKKSVLLGFADDMAVESGAGRVNALRRSVLLEPDVRALDQVEFGEPHRRGEILIAATMRAFVDAWIRRLEAPEETKTEFIELRRVVDEGADVARTLLTMAIRALSYVQFAAACRAGL